MNPCIVPSPLFPPLALASSLLRDFPRSRLSIFRSFSVTLNFPLAPPRSAIISLSLRAFSLVPVRFLSSSPFSRSALVLPPPPSPPPPPALPPSPRYRHSHRHPRAPSLLSFFARFAFQSISRCKLELYGCERWMRREFIYAAASRVPRSCIEAFEDRSAIIGVNRSRSIRINFIQSFAGF